jgi:ATP/maltotriose-dependent transcriptional regulator MalT
MLREMSELLDRYTESQPLLLVTEDLHWSDRSTVQLIDYVARRHSGARLMWLASFRPAQVVALDHPLNAVRRELRLHDLCEEIALDSFSEAEVADYVAQRAPALRGDEAFVHALHERTDGVPLFVASIMSEALALAARDGKPAVIPAQLAHGAMPQNLAAAIDHYIDRLGNEQRAVLSVGAVCGVEFRVATVAAALERDVVQVGEICEALSREQVWLTAARAESGSNAGEPAYSFRHALFRQVLYERMTRAACAQLHSKVGAALEGERAAGAPIAAAELAIHFERGGEPMIAVRYYTQAADLALLQLSPEQCLALTERGLILLEHTPGSAEGKALELALATLQGESACQVLGVTLQARSAFERAYALLADLPRHPMRSRLLYGYGFLLCLRAEYGEALAVADRAQSFSSEIEDPVLALAACLVHAEVDQLQGRWHAARDWAQRGLDLVEAADFTPGVAFVADPHVMLLGLLAIPLLHFGLVEEGRGHLQRAHARARELRQPMTRMAAIWHDALFEVRLGDPLRVAALADEMRALAGEVALAHARNGCAWFRGWADARMGQPLEGYRSIRQAYCENMQLGWQAGGSETLAYAAEALLLAGDWDAAGDQLEEALQVARTHGERVYLTQLLLMQAAIARARGDRAAASTSIRRALKEARAQEAAWLELIALLELCDGGDAQTQDRTELAALLDKLPQARDTSVAVRARRLLSGTKAA